MAKSTRLSLILVLLAAPLRAAGVRVDAVETAPSLNAPTGSIPTAVPLSLTPLTAPSFAPAPALSPALAAPSLAAPTAGIVAAPAAVPATLPSAVPAAAPALSAAPAAAAAISADGAKSPAAAGAAVEAVDDSGRALFDQAAARKDATPIADIVKTHSGRNLKNGVFIQQEHEGSLLSPDPRDSSGNIFRYYKPVEMRPDLAAQTQAGLGGFSKLVFAVKSAFQFRDRGTPEAQWRAWSNSAKLDYLDRLEKATVAEKGVDAAWNGKVSLLLTKTAGAPDFVTVNPHMEAPPAGLSGAPGAKFLQPEIVSAKENPASSVNGALGRAKVVISDTGHAGVQFHVFVKADPAVLLAQMDRLDGALQLINDALYAKAASGSDINITHPSLLPWHRGRSERVRELLTRASKDAHAPAAEDPDSEKHAFVGFRYWGAEDGKVVVSFELRGASLPFKRSASRAAGQGMDNPSLPERDYEEARRYLTFLSLYAEALAAGRAPSVSGASRALDEAAAESYLSARAAAIGVPSGAYDGLAAMARRLTDAKTTPSGYLFPFAASAPNSPELNAFADEVLRVAVGAKAAEEAGRVHDRAHLRYLYWMAYKSWADRFGARADARLDDLFRASAR